jgi:hypothetical protein
VPALNQNGVLDNSIINTMLPYQIGRFYFNSYGTLYSSVPEASKLYFVWIRIPNAITLLNMQTNSYATPSAAISLRYGAYSADPVTGAPSQLLVDCGTVSISSNVTPTLNFPSGGLAVNAPGIWLAVGTDTTLNGWEWVAFQAPTTIGFPAINAAIGNINAAILYCGYSITSWTFGALPATAAGCSYDTQSSNFPVVSVGT